MPNLYRFELSFEDRPQDVGLFSGLYFTGISEKKADSLIEPFKNLTVPKLNHDCYTFWFTDYGCQEFLPAITAIRNVIRPHGWNLICKTLPDTEVTRSAAAYEDSHQVALINGALLPETTSRKFDLRDIKQILKNKPPKSKRNKIQPALVTFENNFHEGVLELQSDNPDALAAITIDGYPKDEHKQGRIVCKIWLTKHGDIIVSPNDNDYMRHKFVRELIQDSIETLKQEFANRK